MEHSKLYRLLKNRWNNKKLPVTTYMEVKEKTQGIVKKSGLDLSEGNPTIGKEFEKKHIEGISPDKEIIHTVKNILDDMRGNNNDNLVERLVEEIMRGIELRKDENISKTPLVMRHTFDPQVTFPPDYCIEDNYCMRDFIKHPHDAFFTQDIKRLEHKVKEKLEIINELETKPTQPGTKEHDDILRTYCLFINTTNELKDIEHKLISFERRFLVRKIMEDSIIGLLKCKNKLTTVEASNITYTINMIISLGIPMKNVQTDIPRIDTHQRVKEIKELIKETKERLEEINEVKVFDKSLDDTNREESFDNRLDDINEEQIEDFIEMNDTDNSTEREKGSIEDDVTLIDMIKQSLRDQGSFGNREKNLLQESPMVEHGRLKNNLDERSTNLLEKIMYQRILVKRNPKLFSFERFTKLSEKRLDEFGVYLHSIEDLFENRTLGTDKKRLLVLIQKHWRGYIDRKRTKPMKENYLQFCNLIKKFSLKKFQESNEKIEEDQKAYLELYEKMYFSILKFIDSNKKFEYTRGTLLEVLDCWRENHRERKELPLSVKKFYHRVEKSKYIGFIEFEEIFDFVRIEIRSIIKNKEDIKLNYETDLTKSEHNPKFEIDFQTDVLHSVPNIVPESNPIIYDSLRAEIHRKLNPFTQDSKLKILRDLLLLEETIQNKKSNEDTKPKLEKSPTPSEIMRSINLLITEYEEISPTVNKDLHKQKQLLENAKKQRGKECRKSVIANEVTPALTNVVEDISVDLFADLILKKKIDGNEKLDTNHTKRHGLSNTESSSDDPIENIIKELIKNNIITSYPETKIEDFYGKLCHGNEDIIFDGQIVKRVKDPLYTSQWVVQAIKEFCILPLFSQKTHCTGPLTKSVFLAGPPCCGKKMMVDAVCSHVGAVKFDLSAETIRKSTFYKTNTLEKLETYVMRAGRYLQPSVFFVNEAHTPYLLSDPPKVPENRGVLDILFEAQMEKQNIDSIETSNQEVNSRTDFLQYTFEAPFLKDIIAYLLSQITKDDMILIMGVSSKPFMSDIKIVEQAFNKILVFPRVDYNTARQYLCDKIMANERVDRSFNFHVLADLCTGLPIPFMQPLIDHVFTLERQAKLCGPAPKPLDTDEFVELLIPLRDKIVSRAYENLIFDWNAGSKMGKLRSATLKKWKGNLQVKNDENQQ